MEFHAFKNISPLRLADPYWSIALGKRHRPLQGAISLTFGVIDRLSADVEGYDPGWGIRSAQRKTIVTKNRQIVDDVLRRAAEDLEKELSHIDNEQRPSLSALCSMALQATKNDEATVSLNVLLLILLHALDDALGILRGKESTPHDSLCIGIALTEIAGAIDLIANAGNDISPAAIRKEFGSLGGLAQAARFEPIQKHAVELANLGRYKSRRNAAMGIKDSVLEFANKKGIKMSPDQAVTTISGWLKDGGYTSSTG
ncbi:hypothetical protein [Pandoraea sp.]|uniref:hypothetical protein n=1 Tax=Pandoraea sp. TaxID=1883445 RepID=UPI0035B029A2